MAPVKGKKRQSSSSTSGSAMTVSEFPAPPTQARVQVQEPARTPERATAKPRTRTVTLRQKQALIDNLQLEITERARRLRAQYAMQAQGLRSRIEIRVNRVPKALRTVKMGELLAKYTAEEEQKKLGSPPSRSLEAKAGRPAEKKTIKAPQSLSTKQKPDSRGIKRSSDEIHIDDKENTDRVDLNNPRKRTKAQTAQQPTARAVSRGKVQPNQVLSPKSSNSRAIPRSPVRPTSPMKGDFARPASPVKPFSVATSTLAGIAGKGKTAAARGRAAAQPARTAATGQKSRPPSSMSDASTGTVIKGKTAKRQPTQTKTVASSTAASRAKKPSTLKAEAPATTRRVLRKRA